MREELFRSFSSAPLAPCDSSQGSPCMYSNIDPDSNYYLRIRNCNDAIVNYNILVKKEGSEGSVNNPVHLTLETSHVGAIGFYETSYFTFTTDKSGTYDIILDQTLSWSYTSSPDFTGTGYAYGSTTANLDANRTYYLKVTNLGNPGIMQIYTVKVAHGASEGSITTPISLTVGTTYRATVGTQGKSYYTFTTLAAADYYVKFDNPTALVVHAYTRAATASSVLFSLNNAPTWNTLEFSIDGTVQPGGTFYNMPLWKRVIFFPTPGQHTYKWCFNENYSGTPPPDSAWVDDIEFAVNPLVQVVGLSSRFATIQDAYAAAVANSMTNPVLKAQAVTFDGPFTFKSPVDVIFKGGLDPTFTSVIGYSYLNGALSLTSGSLKAGNVVIK